MAYADEVLADSPALYMRVGETVAGTAPEGNTVAADASSNALNGLIYTGEAYMGYTNPYTGKKPIVGTELGHDPLVAGGLGAVKDGYVMTGELPLSNDYTIEFVVEGVEPGFFAGFQRVVYYDYMGAMAQNITVTQATFAQRGSPDQPANVGAYTYAQSRDDITNTTGNFLGYSPLGQTVPTGVRFHVAIVRRGMNRTYLGPETYNDPTWSQLSVYVNGELCTPYGDGYNNPTPDFFDLYGDAAPASAYPGHPPLMFYGRAAKYSEIAYYTHEVSQARLQAHALAMGATIKGAAAGNSLRAMTASGTSIAVPVKMYTQTAGVNVSAWTATGGELAVPVDLRTADAGANTSRFTTGYVANPIDSPPPEITWGDYGEPNTPSTGLDPSAASVGGFNILVPPTIQTSTLVNTRSFTSEPIVDGNLLVGEYVPAPPRWTSSARMIVGMDTAEVYALDPIAITVAVAFPDEGSSSVVDTLVLPPIRVRTRVSLSISTPIPDTTVYRVRVVDLNGNRMAELENAVLSPIPWKVSGTTNFGFKMPAQDPKAEWCQEVRREVQVWRNDRLLWWGPIIRTTNNGKELDVQCSDTSFYFSRRVIGRVPKENLLVSEDGMPAGISGWMGDWLPRSEPETPPAKTSTVENTYNDKASMRLSSSVGKEKKTFSNDDWYNNAKLTSKAKTDIRKIMDELTEFTTHPRVMVRVFDDNTGTRSAIDARAQARAEAITDFILSEYTQAKIVTATPAYRDPLNDNSTPAEREENRRTVLLYKAVDGIKGHKQHVKQTITLRNPKSSERKELVSFTAYVYIEDEAGWAAGTKGVELVRSDPKVKHPDPKWAKKGYKKPLQTSAVLFGDGFPAEKWARVQCSVVLPNNGKKSQIEVRLFPPNGDILFTEMWLTREHSLTFKRQEQADIIKALVEHAQDPALGKSDLNIGTNIPKTGVKRSRDYPWEERATILELLNEFPTLADGMEWKIDLTPETRTLSTHFPRMGRDTDVVLAYGSNAVSYGVASDGTLLATTVIIQAPTGDDHTREERTVSDPTLMDGVIMEMAYDGTPNSPASSWIKQAERGLARYRRPITMPAVVMDPAFTDELLDTVGVGDRLLTNITDTVANVDSITKCRVTQITLDPATDSLTYDLYPEDIGVKTLSAFNAPVRYLSQAQNPIVGASGKKPVQSNTEFAGRGYDDSGWATGPAGVGWVKDATGDVTVRASHIPQTTVPNTHEVWLRKWVYCTGDMVLSLRIADWGYLYVNGHLVGNDHFSGYNRFQKAGFVNLRIPSSWLDPSGNQLVALHAQFDPARRSSDQMDSLFADVAVRGTVGA